MTWITVAGVFAGRASVRQARSEAQPKAVRVTDYEVPQPVVAVGYVVNDGDVVVRSPPVHSVYVVHHDSGVDPDAALGRQGFAVQPLVSHKQYGTTHTDSGETRLLSPTQALPIHTQHREAQLLSVETDARLYVGHEQLDRYRDGLLRIGFGHGYIASVYSPRRRRCSLRNRSNRRS